MKTEKERVDNLKKPEKPGTSLVKYVKVTMMIERDEFVEIFRDEIDKIATEKVRSFFSLKRLFNKKK